MLNVMIDLETMGKNSNAAIVAIGAVIFHPEKNTLGEFFYKTVDLESSIRNGGVVDASTINWWLAQGESARAALLVQPEHIAQVLYDFRHWLERNQDVTEEVLMWGNGAAFDNVILANAYRRNENDAPWAFWNDRCYRTVKSLHPHIKMMRSGTHHNALDDAISQAEHLMIMLNSPFGISQE